MDQRPNRPVGGPKKLLVQTNGILSGSGLKNKHGTPGRNGIPDLPDSPPPHFPQPALFHRHRRSRVEFSRETCENQPRRSFQSRRLQRLQRPTTDVIRCPDTDLQESMLTVLGELSI
jgi:hypothetical protein